MNRRLIVVLVTAVLFAGFVIGCSKEMAPITDPWPEARPLARHHPAYEPTREISEDDHELTISQVAGVDPVGDLSLEDALSIALKRNPTLAAVSWEGRMREAAILQAGFKPNPELAVRLDDFGGSGDTSGFDNARFRLMLRQQIESGGRPDKRTDVASRERDLAGWDYEQMRIEVATETTKRFAEVWIAQQRVKVYEQMVINAKRTNQQVDELMSIGRMRRLEADKAMRRKVEAEVELEKAKRKLTAAQFQLAAMWGSREVKFTEVLGVLSEVKELPQTEMVYNLSHQNPQVARWTDEVKQRKAALALARVEGKADVTAGIGYRWDTGDDSSDILLDFQYPLQVNDRNQGNILEARYAVIQALSAQKVVQVAVQSEIAKAYQLTVAAGYEAKMLHDEVLPVAINTYAAMEESFAAGVTSLDDLLDAQREVIRAEEDYYDALLDYQQLLAELEGLVGQKVVQ